MEKIKLIIADDHPVVTEGLMVILKSDVRFTVCGAFKNADSVINFLQNETVDIIILDIDMPGSEDFRLLKTIKEVHPHCKIIMFTLHEGAHHFFEALKYGADSYVLKSESVTFLPTVIMHTMKGIFYCSDDVKKHLSKDGNQQKLKPIEGQIFGFLTQGLQYNEIARRIGKSEKTIEYYIYKLRKKYNVQTNAELVVHLKETYMK